MEEIDDLVVEVIDDYIWEVSLEQMAQFVFEFNLKAIPYEKTAKGSMLIGILTRTSDKIVGNYLMARSLIVNTIYCFVDGYKRLLIYDPINETVDYTNDNTGNRYELTHTIAVTTYPHFLIKIATKCIEQKLEKEEEQGVSKK